MPETAVKSDQALHWLRGWRWLLLFCSRSADQALYNGSIQSRREPHVNSFFNLVRAHNEGAAFSFLSDAGGWQRWFLRMYPVVVSAVIVVWLTRLPRSACLRVLALSLILGGALGNLYDRLTLGYVVDFLDFHWSGWHFAAFNVADMGISVGAGLIIVDALFFQPSESDSSRISNYRPDSGFNG